jgi:hypothetical protein
VEAPRVQEDLMAGKIHSDEYRLEEMAWHICNKGSVLTVVHVDHERGVVTLESSSTVEHQPLELVVEGSNPSSRTKAKRKRNAG